MEKKHPRSLTLQPPLPHNAFLERERERVFLKDLHT